MKMKWMTRSTVAVVFSVVVGLLLVPGLLLAHHNHQAMTNYNLLIGVTGVVTRYDYINPHSMIHVSATDENGNQDEWIGYGGSPGIESRLGYSAHMFNVGTERITMYGFQQKDGKKIITFTKIIRANGEDLPVSQVERGDMDAFLTLHNVRTFKELPETLKRYIGGIPYQANDDK